MRPVIPIVILILIIIIILILIIGIIRTQSDGFGCVRIRSHLPSFRFLGIGHTSTQLFSLFFAQLEKIICFFKKTSYLCANRMRQQLNLYTIMAHNNTTKNHRMTLTDAELNVLYYALNDFSLEMMEKSATWGKGLGWEDGFHREAMDATTLQARIYKIMNK